MAAQGNGTPKGSKGAMNAQTNGSIHGPSSKSRSSRSKRKNKSTWVGWTIDKGLKVFIWYSLYTIVFRCPSQQSEITEGTPQVCGRYLATRDFVVPYAQPYYDQYLAPHVQKVQPYLDRANEQVYQPALLAYQQHGAPRVEQAQKVGTEQWEKTIKPQLEVARQQAGKQYDATLAPYVKKVDDVVRPHYDSVKTSATDIWQLEIEPVYRNTAPYAEKLYTHGRKFAVDTLLPQAEYAGSAAWSLWARQLWPKMRVLYGESVEPQLMRITERLGRYKDGKKLEAEIKSMEISSSLAQSSSTAVSAASSLSSFAGAATESPSSAATVVASSATAGSTVDAAEQFKADLKSWEEVCATAVDEGAQHLKERIKDIADHHAKSQISGTGNALVTQLEETVDSAIYSVKAHILSIVGGIPDDADEARLEDAHTSLIQGIRNAGQNVKSSAQEIREWKQKYEAELDSSVDKALQSTLETIDGIRELRLTEIGRKYADKGLAHKEWSEYNELKKATRVWRDDVEKVTVGNADITKAKEAAEEIEQKGMAIAEEVAKELGRLKEVAKWKVDAGDATDNFDTKHIPAAAEKAKKQVVDQAAGVSQAVVGSSKPVDGSVESATSVAGEKASEMASSASQAVVGSSSSGLSDSATDVASQISQSVVGTPSGLSDSATDAASQATEAVLGSETPAVSSISSSLSSKVADSPVSKSLGPKAASILSAGKAKKDAASKSASSAAVDGSSIASSAASDASARPSSAVEDAASSVSSAVSGASEGASSFTDDAASSVSSAVSGASESVSSFTDDAAASVSSITSGASAGASSLTDNISSSVSSASADASDSAFSLADNAASTISSGSSVASESIPTNAAEAEETFSAKKGQNQKVFAGANAQVIVEAREPILDDTVEDTYSESMQSMVNAALDEATKLTQVIADAMQTSTATGAEGVVETVSSIASEQYESAMSAASSVLFGTAGQESKGSLAAKEQYSSAVQAASYAIHGTPTTAAAMSSVSSFADSAMSNVAAATDYLFDAAMDGYNSAATAAWQSSKSARKSVLDSMSGKPRESTHKRLFMQIEEAYVEAVSVASESYERVTDALSATISAGGLSDAYASATNAAISKASAASLWASSTQNAYESISSIASSRLAEGLSAASEQYQSAKVAVGAEPTPAQQAYLASAQRAYYEGLGMAHDRYSSFVDAASGVVGATPTTTGYDDYVAAAQRTYTSALAAASERMQFLMNHANNAAAAKGEQPQDSVMNQILFTYEQAVDAASSQLLAASAEASKAVYGTQAGTYAQATEAAGSAYSDAASAVSSAISGSETPWTEAMASQASQNWEALVSSASEQIYGQPPPFTESVYSQANAYAAQATEAAAQQYEAVQALFYELVSGKEPDFTDSVMNRLQSAYSTGAPAAISSASSYASEAYASASSAVEAMFTPPASLDTLLAQVNEQLNGAVDAASAQYYGSTKGTYESATEAAASAYSDAASSVSEAVYGRETGYAESAQLNMQEIAAAASKSLSEAIYGTQTGTVEAASSSAASVYDSLTSAASERAAAVSSAISSAIYGEEQSYVESVQSQISAAMASAQSRIAEFGEGASSAAADAVSQVSDAAADISSQVTDVAGDTMSKASEAVADAASSVSSAVTSATDRVRDEL